ncbi:MAG: hypothetical protein ACXWQR_14455 [Ktedonobacterales bacterium]
METPYYDVWPLTGLIPGMTADVVLAIAGKAATVPLPRRGRSELTELLVVLAGTRIARQVLA